MNLYNIYKCSNRRLEAMWTWCVLSYCIYICVCMYMYMYMLGSPLSWIKEMKDEARSTKINPAQLFTRLRANLLCLCPKPVPEVSSNRSPPQAHDRRDVTRTAALDLDAWQRSWGRGPGGLGASGTNRKVSLPPKMINLCMT